MESAGKKRAELSRDDRTTLDTYDAKGNKIQIGGTTNVFRLTNHTGVVAHGSNIMTSTQT